MRRIRTKTLRRGKRVAAIAMSALLVAAPVAALADGGISVDDGSEVTHDGDIVVSGNETGVYAGNSSTVTQNGDVTAGFNGVDAEGGSTITVNGDVSTNGDTAFAAVGRGNSTVTVNGNVSSTGTSGWGVDAVSSDVTVSGNVTTEGNYGTGIVTLNSGSTVTVGGNVITQGDNAEGIFASTNSVITVGGNVITQGDNAEGIYALRDSIITVGGSVTSANDSAIVTYGSSVTVEGDATGAEAGLLVHATSDTATYDNNTIVVKGTINGGDVAIGVIGDKTSALPTIVTTSLQSDGELFGYYDNDNDELQDEIPEDVENALVAAVYYIVNANGFTTDADTIEANGSTYLVKQEGDTLTLTLATPDGYELDDIDWGEYVTTVVDNGDGTYTITVVRGGNLTFSATYKPVASDDGASDDEASATVRTASVTTATAEAIPSTGDSSAAPVLLVSLAGLALCGTGALARRRQRG